ncbi:UDP-N-acetylglucosamine 2-epimerase (non-hydrolyzing) [Candidatus Nomurabacteria bacterium]|nr:UDP-N-acetylglucosamine 2-epimerase (non-hydrolyzing) [Candidatus Nomurabacteria bacterium]
MKRLKVMTIIGTRPEIIKLSRVIHELDQNTDHVLVHTGQNYDHELNRIFFKEMELREPNHVLKVVGQTLAETIGNIIAKSDEVIAQEKPDAVLLYGDTNSCLSIIPAKRRKIPIFHMEAGNRSFDQRVPEEINRKIVDHLSDINMPLTEHARKYLLAEGIRPETVIKIGSPMKEIITHYWNKIESSDILAKLKIEKNKFFVVSAHREENVDPPEQLTNLVESLNAITEKYGFPIIVSTHPRTRKRLEALNLHKNMYESNPMIQFLKPLGLFDYIRLQQGAYCVVSDSGTITEEASLLNLPAVTIREAHERPEGMDEGVLIMCGLRSERILQSIDIVTAQTLPRTEKPFSSVPDYNVDCISKKVVRIIMSYTDYVNRNVWRQ